eukprot:8033929-Pyramimonas_sp.AAC.1
MQETHQYWWYKGQRWMAPGGDPVSDEDVDGLRVALLADNMDFFFDRLGVPVWKPEDSPLS